MGFEVAAESYDTFMGRYSRLLAPGLADLAGVDEGQRALDVGCGPGALTSELVRRLGDRAVTAVDPSSSFVSAVRERFPQVEVRLGSAEQLPFDAGAFDAALAQLVFHFMRDPVQGAREMARVTRKGGLVAACVWDFAGGRSPVSPFWTAAREIDAAGRDESALPGARRGHLAEVFAAAGLREVEERELEVSVPFESFDTWWQPFTLGVGPAGDYVRKASTATLEAIRSRCLARLGGGPVVISAVAWAARGIS